MQGCRDAGMQGCRCAPTCVVAFVCATDGFRFVMNQCAVQFCSTVLAVQLLQYNCCSTISVVQELQCIVAVQLLQSFAKTDSPGYHI